MYRRPRKHEQYSVQHILKCDDHLMYCKKLFRLLNKRKCLMIFFDFFSTIFCAKLCLEIKDTDKK